MKLVLIFFLLINIIYSKEPKKHGQYKVSDIINLILSCQTKQYKIIDPNDYIKQEHERQLEKQLKTVYKNHKVITIIVVIRSAYLKDENNKEIDLSEYTQSILDEIYERGIVEKKDPVIISVISIEEKIMSMKTQGTVSHTITQQDCYNILSIVNNYFSYGESSYGAVELGKLIDYYLVNTGFFSRNKRFFYMILLLILCFCFCYILALIAQKIKDRRNMRLTMSDEEKLLKIREFLKKTKVNKKILSDCCIICLDSFENCISITHTITNEYQRKKIQTNSNDIIIDMENETNVNSNVNTNENTNRFSMEFKEQIELQNLSSNINNINNENNIYNSNKENNYNINNENNNNIMNNDNITINNDDDIESNIPRNYDITDNQISTLPCGHRYHVKCSTEWMIRKKNICPMCREKIDVDIPDIDDEDLQNELLNIQIELHPAFALLVFQTINEELTWGAMSLPAINGGLFSGLSGFAFI